jgi:ribonuclease P protein component
MAAPDPADAPAAVETLRRRADFLAAARARRWAAPSFTLQGRARAADEAPGALRVGYTCSKKVGNAVARNRAKRRLRAAAATLAPRLGRPGWDYVLIGRPEATAARPFALLLDDLARAFAQVHAPARPPKPKPAP